MYLKGNYKLCYVNDKPHKLVVRIYGSVLVMSLSLYTASCCAFVVTSASDLAAEISASKIFILKPSRLVFIFDAAHHNLHLRVYSRQPLQATFASSTSNKDYIALVDAMVDQDSDRH